ncbi:hypothetical protein [Photobacterium kasasachensis]|uniref:hypothetical protein n=1 Tax=Photobacterium kasasachensis TaxID=2910240 RepID=UPI003D10180A
MGRGLAAPPEAQPRRIPLHRPPFETPVVRLVFFMSVDLCLWMERSSQSDFLFISHPSSDTSPIFVRFQSNLASRIAHNYKLGE